MPRLPLPYDPRQRSFPKNNTRVSRFAVVLVSYSAIMVKKTTKNKKKTWKKIDVQEVDDHLQDERLNERLGPIDSRISFVIDTTATDSAPKPLKKKTAAPHKLVQKSDLISGLKCFKSLVSTSKVPAMKARAGPKHKVPKITLKEEQRSTRNTGIRSRSNVSTDLWAADEEVDEKSELIREQERLCGKHKVKVPVSLRKKPNLVAAVQLPDPGISYNPSDADLDSLVKKVVKEEVSRIRKERSVEQAVTRFYQSKSPAQIEAEYMQEMAQGLHVSDTDSDSDAVETPETVCEKKPVRAENRKTKAQRNREAHLRMISKQRKVRKEAEKKSKQPLGIPKILKQIKEKEKVAVLRKSEREEKAKKRMLEPKKRNRHLLVEQVVPDPADMSGSLRRVRVAGNLLEDRFSSFVARSLIEVKKAKKRKSGHSLPDKKLYVKRSHRSDVC
jgi:nucleolar protein 53